MAKAVNEKAKSLLSWSLYPCWGERQAQMKIEASDGFHGRKNGYGRVGRGDAVCGREDFFLKQDSRQTQGPNSRL